MEKMNLTGQASGKPFMFNTSFCQKFCDVMQEKEGISEPITYTVSSVDDGIWEMDACSTDKQTHWKIQVEDNRRVYVKLSDIRTNGSGTYTVAMKVLATGCRGAHIQELVISDVRSKQLRQWCTRWGFSVRFDEGTKVNYVAKVSEIKLLQ